MRISEKTSSLISTTFLKNLGEDRLEEKLAESYLGILANDDTLFNPLGNMPDIAGTQFPEYILYLMTQPDYFYFLIKYILNIESYPLQVLVIRELFQYRFPILLGSRGFGKSFSLAVYILLRMILVPDTKCVITAAGFRQAKVVFDYMETIWKKSEVLRSCFKGGSGPTHGTDVWTFRLGNSITYALPVGPDGSKVRGYRANCLDGNTLIETTSGLIKIKDYKDEELFSIGGLPEKPSSFYRTELTDLYRLTTKRGYSLKFSKVHQLWANRDGADQWIVAKDLKEGDSIYLDNLSYFPSDCLVYDDDTIMDESYLFYGGPINLSSLAAPEVPFYILKSPRRIVKRYLSLLLGTKWLGATYKTKHRTKVDQLAVLLLKFNYLVEITQLESGCFQLTVDSAHNGVTNPTDQFDSLQLVDQDYLYDFVMGESHSYLGGGFLNHNCLIGEEFAASNRQVFEEVMSGFLSVASSPIEQIKETAKLSTYKKLSIPIPKSNGIEITQNQLILSGTAYYKINHFYQYFLKWRDIIRSKSNPKLLESLFENQEDRDAINPDDYSIIRIPIELVTAGYMDMAQINRIKASTTKDVFLREYNAVFSNDSDGFYRKQLIDSCTVEDLEDPKAFSPRLYGDKTKKHIFGVDPAYEGDNFAIIVLEMDGPTRKVVYCWTTQASDHKQRLLSGTITENDYFHYCARKIRDLMKRFPCEYIALDKHGGGSAVMEAFMDKTKLYPDELPILPTIEATEGTKETDIMEGLHIIKVIKPTSEWNSEANYGLKKDMEDKTIRFPFNDAISYSLAEFYDESLGDNKTLYDTLDDCIFDIEELKKELTTITISETSMGREKFDTPTIKKGINQKGRLKKDRYSALLMANWVARSLEIDYIHFENPDLINLAGFAVNGSNDNRMFLSRNDTTKKLEDLYNSL